MDRTHAVDPAKFVFGNKAQIRRRIEAEGIPYIYICNDLHQCRFLPSLVQVEDTKVPPRDRAVILGDGNTKDLKREISKARIRMIEPFIKGLQVSSDEAIETAKLISLKKGLLQLNITNCKLRVFPMVYMQHYIDTSGVPRAPLGYRCKSLQQDDLA
ncbi:hypothetical protein Syun_014373 [Stephania yunnanensis]|uniref:NmrA-like domain-containing protein n=1 Tax=Stephania yunnanensis TaxID=152371 RepID=A0AAP0JJ76_9MAGN